MADKEKSKGSFRDTILIVFVVILCFGLTIYGIVYLTGKVFTNEEKIEIAKLKSEKISTDPESGDVLTFSSEEEKPIVDNITQDLEEDSNNVEQNEEPTHKVVVGNKIASDNQSNVKKESQKEVTKQKEQEKQVKKEQPKKQVKETPKKEEKQVAKVENKKPVSNMKSKGAFVVQIMAVKNLKEAEKEANKYRNICSDVFIQKADLGSKGTWYRIRCGASNSKAEASKTRDLLKQKFKGITPQVVSNK